MRSILSALVFALWTVGYAHCLAEQHGLIGMEDFRCCAEENHPEDEPGSAPIEQPQDLPCSLCDFINSGALSVIQPLEIAAAVLFLVPDWLNPLGQVLFEDLPVSQAPEFIDTGQSRLVRLWEYVVRTALPVRGPCLVS